jgi:hypothetical protein
MTEGLLRFARERRSSIVDSSAARRTLQVCRNWAGFRAGCDDFGLGGVCGLSEGIAAVRLVVPRIVLLSGGQFAYAD